MNIANTINTIYCDFDGTITKNDSVNRFFEMYASKNWIDSEKLWIEGKISSRENAIIQVSLLKNVSQQQLDDYANQNNPNNSAYQADNDNHANQCNPNNDEYWHSRED